MEDEIFESSRSERIFFLKEEDFQRKLNLFYVQSSHRLRRFRTFVSTSKAGHQEKSEDERCVVLWGVSA